MPGQKRIAHHIVQDRKARADKAEMDYILGRKSEKTISAPAPKGNVGVSDNMIDELTARRKKFSLGTAK